MRVNLGVAIVAMVNHTATDDVPVPDSNFSSSCPAPLVPANTTAPTEDGPFVWDIETQNWIMGFFYLGYLVLQIPGGIWAENEKIGGKWVLGLGILVTSVFTLLSPLAAKSSIYVFAGVRFIEGEINNRK